MMFRSVTKNYTVFTFKGRRRCSNSLGFVKASEEEPDFEAWLRGNPNFFEVEKARVESPPEPASSAKAEEALLPSVTVGGESLMRYERGEEGRWVIPIGSKAPASGLFEVLTPGSDEPLLTAKMQVNKTRSLVVVSPEAGAGLEPGDYDYCLYHLVGRSGKKSLMLKGVLSVEE